MVWRRVPRGLPDGVAWGVTGGESRGVSTGVSRGESTGVSRGVTTGKMPVMTRKLRPPATDVALVEAAVAPLTLGRHKQVPTHSSAPTHLRPPPKRLPDGQGRAGDRDTGSESRAGKGGAKESFMTAKRLPSPSAGVPGKE